mgnify:CR=1 FL=1
MLPDNSVVPCSPDEPGAVRINIMELEDPTRLQPGPITVVRECNYVLGKRISFVEAGRSLTHSLPHCVGGPCEEHGIVASLRY